ncbi:acrB/AcrD/AcrF family domain-containing protein [Ditylenchus destructor]|nr:acrB/AcrD/AcrF family domain-containing protein [Ditylenchus destructor]
MPSTELSDYVETLLARQISQIDGVGQINITGQQRPAIRVQASPDKLAAIGLTLADIRLAIQQSSLNLAKGAIYGENSVSTLSTNDQLFHPEDYAQLIVSYKDGAPVQLRDIAKVINGSENAYVQAWAGDTPGVNLVISRQPGRISSRPWTAFKPNCRACKPCSRRRCSGSDAADRHSAGGGGDGVVPAPVVGNDDRVQRAGGVVGCQLCADVPDGFQFEQPHAGAIVIAVGFVVDDAIVVVENIHRHLEAGLDKREAAIKGAGEIGFTVVSISFSLVAAFIPLLFMGGVVGRLFKEFALTATSTILISVVVSLTLAPTLAALFMRAPTHHAHDKPGFSERLLAAMHATCAVPWPINAPWRQSL